MTINYLTLYVPVVFVFLKYKFLKFKSYFFKNNLTDFGLSYLPNLAPCENIKFRALLKAGRDIW